MGKVTIIGVDLAKNVFQVHGAGADGSVLFRKKLSRSQFARFMASQPPCLVAMEACASAHHWAREIARHGHEVRLIAPHYVKPFLKRQKNDAADAEAIVEAALRPTMRFVEPKSADQQARAVAFRTREQLVKQRTEAVNALRSHLYEFGHVAPEGIGYVPRLERVLEDPDTDIPDLARDICRMLAALVAPRFPLLKLRAELFDPLLNVALGAAAFFRFLQRARDHTPGERAPWNDADTIRFARRDHFHLDCARREVVEALL